jgi:2-iminoacetate synthase
MSSSPEIICDKEIRLLLEKPAEASRAREALARARELNGLPLEEAAALMSIREPGLLQELHETARRVKQDIYGARLVLFAPLYISNACSNECTYCAFRAQNAKLKRRTLSQEEIALEIKALISQGHKRVLVVAGEDYHPGNGVEYVLKTIRTIYGVKAGHGEIRRVNVNIAPLSVNDFSQRFQEAQSRGDRHLPALSGNLSRAKLPALPSGRA